MQSAGHVATTDGVIDVLMRHPQLQRSLLVTADTAIIGRPTERVTDLLAGETARPGRLRVLKPDVEGKACGTTR